MMRVLAWGLVLTLLCLGAGCTLAPGNSTDDRAGTAPPPAAGEDPGAAPPAHPDTAHQGPDGAWPRRTVLGPFAGSTWRTYPSPDGDRLLLYIAGEPGAGEPSSSLVVVNTQTGSLESRVELDPGQGAPAPTGEKDAVSVLGWQGADQIVLLRHRVEGSGPYNYQGRIERLELDSGEVAGTVDIELRLSSPFPPGLSWLTRTGDRAYLHFDFEGRLVEVDLVNGRVQPVLDGLPVWDGLYRLEPAPDGTAVAFADRTGFFDLASRQYRGPDDPHTAAAHPAWSPDGRYLAYTAAGRGEDGQAPVEVVVDSVVLMGERVDVVDRDGRLVASFKVPGARVYAPRWLPDGARVAFREIIRNPEVEPAFEESALIDGRLWIADLATSAVREVPLPLSEPPAAEPLYGPLAFTRDGRWAYFSRQGVVAVDTKTGQSHEFPEYEFIYDPGGAVAVSDVGILVADGGLGIWLLKGANPERVASGPPPVDGAKPDDRWSVHTALTEPLILVWERFFSTGALEHRVKTYLEWVVPAPAGRP